MTQLYEIRNAETGWKLLANATERDVRRFWKATKPTESRTAKESGVIVIYVDMQKVPA